MKMKIKGKKMLFSTRATHTNQIEKKRIKREGKTYRINTGE